MATAERSCVRAQQLEAAQRHSHTLFYTSVPVCGEKKLTPGLLASSSATSHRAVSSNLHVHVVFSFVNKRQC